MVALQQVLITIFMVFFQLAYCQMDTTIEDGPAGKAVVEAVVAKIGDLVFGSDHGFFKRLAYVDTDFGKRNISTRFSGGIWHVKKEDYESTRKNSDGLHEKILQNFGIKWNETKWEDLGKPLYSALALHLFLYNKDKSTLNNGFPRTLEAQARLRSQYVIEGLESVLPKETEFIRMVQEMESARSCNAKLDLVAVLDGARSVGQEDFEKARKFVADWFQQYSPKTARLGFIVASTNVEKRIPLDSHLRAREISSLVLNTLFPESASNVSGGIQAALTSFQEAVPRPGVPKVLAIFTNWKSDGREVVNMTAVAKEEISTYVIAIGGQTDSAMLLNLAQQDSSQVFHLSRHSNPKDLVNRLHRRTCSEPQQLQVGQDVEDILTHDSDGLYGGEDKFGHTVQSVNGNTPGVAHTEDPNDFDYLNYDNY